MNLVTYFIHWADLEAKHPILGLSAGVEMVTDGQKKSQDGGQRRTFQHCVTGSSQGVYFLEQQVR